MRSFCEMYSFGLGVYLTKDRDDDDNTLSIDLQRDIPIMSLNLEV
jgi:hypothetical protein